MSTAEVFGDRVRAARVLRRRKSIDLAQALGWPPSRLTTVEQSHEVTVAEEVLAAFVRELRFPEVFFTTTPPAEVTQSDLLFRAPVATTKREKAYLAEFARVVGEMLAWLDAYHRLPPTRLPSMPPGTPVDEAARKTREKLGLKPDQPIRNLMHRLERAGLPIVVRSPAWDALPEKHLGYSTRVGEHAERPLTVLRAQESWERTRWTVAHEAGHVVLHASTLPENAEQQAHEFAGELLAPAQSIRNEVPQFVTLASLTELKLRWGVSLGGLIRHLHRNELINDERKETLQKQLYTRINPETGRTWGRDEPGRDARAVEEPSLIITWLERCLGSAHPNLVTSISGRWPSDIVAMVIGAQQKPGKTHVSEGSSLPAQSREPPAEDGAVVDLATWRQRSQASQTANRGWLYTTTYQDER